VTVFADTAVIMYAGGRDHPLKAPCQRLLRAAATGADVVTSAEVVQEVLHRFAATDRHRVGAEMARHALDLFAPVLPITHAVMARMPDLCDRYPHLAARDLVHVATCLDAGISELASPDHAFDEVAEVRRLDPATLA
jgi:uncharacterized protein